MDCRRKRRRMAQDLVFAGVLSVLLAGLSGCGGESRRSSDAPGGPPGAGQPAPAPGGAPESPAAAAPAAPPAAPGTWVRLPVVSPSLEVKDGKQTLRVKTRTPSGGWQVELRRLAGSEPPFQEFEVVGMPPAAAAGGTPEEKTLNVPVEVGERSAVLIHGADGATIIEPDPAPQPRPASGPDSGEPAPAPIR